MVESATLKTGEMVTTCKTCTAVWVRGPWISASEQDSSQLHSLVCQEGRQGEPLEVDVRTSSEVPSPAHSAEQTVCSR